MKIEDLINGVCLNKKIYIYLILILLTGIFMMIFSKTEKNISLETSTDITSNNGIYENSSYTYLEQKLSDVLSKIDGVGKVDVFINYGNNKEINNKNNDTKSVLGILKDDSTHKMDNNEVNIKGVFIVDEGGGDTEVVNTLRNVVSNVLGLALHRVNVLKMK